MNVTLTSQVRHSVLGSMRQCAVLLQGPCVLVIFYEYWVADHHQACADSNIHCSPWFDDDDVMPASSRYDSALNLSLRHVSIHERNANSV